ncbi:RNA polymerase sigma-H factor [Capsulimonas corticalis]|uniref:RNA polymerase sigma-H factor n=1 Tax=Capsulimonas corticalis TaxID=2219043 RepID=A0A9N7L4A2_9BACT|nr:RNA polymerase sigma-H factor [Capsulimonas corticalis]
MRDHPVDPLMRDELDSDLRLVQRCAQDDPAAMREIVRRYQPKLYRYLRPLLGTQEDAEEAALDVFLRVWRDAGRFERRSSVSTWVYRIATNIAHDRIRRQQAQRRTAPPVDWTDVVAPDAEAVAIENLEAAERGRLLERCLHQLRVDDRLLLTLYYGEDLGYDEIARITQCPAPLLRVRLMRARRRLRAVMDAAAPEEME